VDRVAAGSPDEELPATTLAERGATPNEGTARLEFQGGTAALGGHEILHGVDARCGPRETVTVLGPTGSGKTTMFRTAMRLLQVTGGAVLVDGASIADKRTTDLVETFGDVFQSPSQVLV